jgi:cell division protein FtsL
MTARAQAATVPPPGLPGLPDVAGKLLEALRRLPDARWLDRMLRGQAWVAVIGVALLGIVAMQVSLLKLNAGIGQSVEKTSTLERQNADLRASVSQLSSEERIQQQAMEMGLVMPQAGEVRYVTVRPDEDPGKAVKIMHAPAPEEASAAATLGATSTATTTDPATGATTTTDPATGATTTTDPATGATTTTDPAATGTTSGATAAPAATTTPQTTTP